MKQNERRVVGSNESTPHKWPWTVQLIYTETRIHRCGATILSDDIVIIAAHCFFRSKTDAKPNEYQYFHHNPARYTVLIGGEEICSGESYNVRNMSGFL
uniref:Peptidase S1 domain-containing protein n=1 Tax=Onchocerca volvulus TaxID=6282 RepID=A0A8R1XP09_ONCVO